MNLQLSKGTSVSKAHKNFKERKNKSKLLRYEKKEKIQRWFIQSLFVS